MRRKTNEEFLAEIKDKKKGLYTPLQPYVKSNEAILVRHNICGAEFNATPNFLLKNAECGCPVCFGNNAKRKTDVEFKKEVYDLVGNEYTFNEAYKNRSIPLSVTHNTCGRILHIAPYNFLNGVRCKECYYASIRLSKDQAEARIQEVIGKDFVIVGGYINMQTDTKIFHKSCGKVSAHRLSDIIYKGVSCSYCSMSNGEKLTKSYLDDIGSTYEMQKTFPGLQNINQLTYDFYLPELRIAIEYQGEQHFKPKNFGGISKEKAVHKFLLQKENDDIKRTFAIENGIQLIEVPYTLNTLSKVYTFLNENIK